MWLDLSLKLIYDQMDHCPTWSATLLWPICGGIQTFVTLLLEVIPFLDELVDHLDDLVYGFPLVPS
jgi:hypothetical protein